MRLNKGDMVMMPEPRMMMMCFMVCVCVCVCVLVDEKIGASLIECAHRFHAFLVALCNLFGRCHLHLVQGEVATNELGVQGNFQDIFETCFHATLEGCFVIFETKEDAVGGKASDWNASGEGFDCWSGHGSCVGHERKLADGSGNARKIFHFSIFISRSSWMNA